MDLTGDAMRFFTEKEEDFIRHLRPEAKRQKRSEE
jgi:hypothetical protein